MLIKQGVGPPYKQTPAEPFVIYKAQALQGGNDRGIRDEG